MPRTIAAQQHSRLARFFWLLVAAMAHCLAAINGVLSRWLQTWPAQPAPATRLALLLNMVSLATLLSFHAAPLLLVRLLRQHSPGQQAPGGDAAPCGPAANKDDGRQTSRCSSKGSDLSAGEELQQHDCEHGTSTSPASGAADEEAVQEAQGRETAALTRQPSAWRPAATLQRGLSARFEGLAQRQPRLHRALALDGLVLFSVGVATGQVVAPGFVDPSIVQLVQMFQVLVICLVQSMLLGHRLPWQLLPAVAATSAGAAMVIVPNLGQSAAGSLGTARGWAGFGMAVATVISGALALILMQATRHMGIKITTLQYASLCASMPLLAAISLPLDGTDWAAQLGSWAAADWGVLVVLGSAVFVGLAFALQLAVWQLGAPTVSLMAGLRLLAAIVFSQLILGTSAVQSGLQIAGIGVVILAVTAFMWWQWSQAQSGGAHKQQPASGSTSAQAATAC